MQLMQDVVWRTDAAVYCKALQISASSSRHRNFSQKYVPQKIEKNVFEK